MISDPDWLDFIILFVRKQNAFKIQTSLVRKHTGLGRPTPMGVTTSNKTLESLHKQFKEEVYNKVLIQFAELIYSATRFLMMRHPDGFKALADGTCFEFSNLTEDEKIACSRIDELLNTEICFYLGLKGSEEATKRINHWFYNDLIQRLGEVYGMHDYAIFWSTETYDIDFESWDPSYVEIMYC